MLEYAAGLMPKFTSPSLMSQSHHGAWSRPDAADVSAQIEIHQLDAGPNIYTRCRPKLS